MHEGISEHDFGLKKTSVVGGDRRQKRRGGGGGGREREGRVRGGRWMEESW